jgi:hypothetical protein
VTVIAQFAEIRRDLERAGIAAFDMRDSGHLETIFVSGAGSGPDDEGPRKRLPLTWLEDDRARPREIRSPAASSPFRFFLDGSQRTLRAFYCESLPVITGIVGGAVLERDARGEPRVLPGMLMFRHVWVVPRLSGIAAVDRLIDIIEARGGEVVDPLDLESPDRYQEALVEFGGMVELAYKRVGRIREQVETDLLTRWCERYGNGDELLLVDGPLRQTAPGAVGLVKSFTRQYLTGPEAMALFRLRHGERSAAFQVEDGWRQGHPVDAWYQRHWDATGRDPRHALVRLELSANWADRPAVDDVAGWILRERLPAARADARWATLLYPVHHLERVLKRHLDAQTRGWSSVR